MGLSREPYGCVRLHDSACLLISENILQFDHLTTRVRIFNHLDSVYLALDHPQVVEPSVVQGPKALPPVLLDDTKSARLDHLQVVKPSVIQGPKALPPVLLDDTKSARLD